MEGRRARLCGLTRLARNHLARELLRIDLGFQRRKHRVGLVLEPELDRSGVNTMVQAPAGGQTDRAMHQSGDWMFLLNADWNAIESNPQILTHTLHTLVLRT